MLSRRLVTLICINLGLAVFAVSLAQQPERKIARIEIEGLQHLTGAEVIATTRLEIGSVFSLEALDAAAQRLADSGLVANIGYRTITKDNEITIIFHVEEAKSGTSPIAFDNFVWFTDDELSAAIKREVPSYNGTAPNSGNMTDDIKRALENLLKERGIDGTVDYAPSTSGGKQEHLFSVAGVPIPICSLHFPGTKNVSESKLIKASKQMTDADYLRSAGIILSNFVLFPIYREVGQLRAKFALPVATLSTSEKCKKGVDVSIAVDEGPIFMWDKAVWTGNEAMSPKELDEVLGMKSGELANGVKIDKGLHAVRVSYGGTGHLDANITAHPEFDDAASRVTYKLEVKEGPQYRMGKLTITGLSDDQAKSLERKWKLKGGEILDTTYFDRFYRKDAVEEMQRIFDAWKASGRRPPNIQDVVTPNRETLIADVTLEFKE
jgi:outer membrane protein assembly factor BamA